MIERLALNVHLVLFRAITQFRVAMIRIVRVDLQSCIKQASLILEINLHTKIILSA